jgi:sec-independent protein translocase protein TatB
VSGGFSFDKLIVIAVLAVFLLGPERIPHYAAQLGRLVRTVREMANGAKERLRDEMGPDFDDVDWKKLDPRQYDPRRIIREALLEDLDADPVSVIRPPASSPKRQRSVGGEAVPFDNEAT